MATLKEIAKARHDIRHLCDGPVNAFTLISRACQIGTEAAANALMEELEDRKWLVSEAFEVYDVGS
jgi:hypothetical protein